MQYIFLNLKRFDLPVTYGGVNRIAPLCPVGERGGEGHSAAPFPVSGYGFCRLFSRDPPFDRGGGPGRRQLAATGVPGGFGHRRHPGREFRRSDLLPPAAAQAAGCQWTLIGHCEERAKWAPVSAGGEEVGRLLGQEVRAAVNRGLKVLYCIGKTEEEQPRWQQVLSRQLELGLRDAGEGEVVIGYEPVWSIGPGKSLPAGNTSRRSPGLSKSRPAFRWFTAAG